jgi:Protein of unknown function (DUF2924)
VSEGFDWQGATYPTLSAIARAITGTAWSSPAGGLFEQMIGR